MVCVLLQFYSGNVHQQVDVLRALGAEIVRTPTSARFDAPGDLYNVISLFLFVLIVFLTVGVYIVL